MANWLRPASAGALLRALSRCLCTATSTESGSFPLKNVTRLNFEEALAELRDYVRAADFVAVDLEMTGVTSAPWRESFEFDRFDVRYLKVKDSAEKFAVVQFGVCPFRWDSSKHSFIAHPHNFYVFPRQELPDDGSYEFLCQATSIDFLAKYQFDFNACIYQGVSYLSRAQEDEALKRVNLTNEENFLDASPNATNFREERLLRMADILFTERMKYRLCEWRDGLLHERTGDLQFKGNSTDSKQQLDTIFFKMRPAISLNGFTSRQLRLVKLVITKHFKDLCYVRVDGENGSSQQLVIYIDSKDDKDLLMKEVREEQRSCQRKKIQAAIGFRHVIDLISAEQKLIVGHNCFLDMAHIYNKFVGPLPSTAEEFVSSFRKFFPHVVDTKVLLNADNVLRLRMNKSSTSLSSAFALLCPRIAFSSQTSGMSFNSSVKVEVQVDDLRSPNWNSGAKHEAGYDAFMTGCVFSQACTHLGIDFKAWSPSEILAHNEKLKKYINNLYLSWNNGEVINLSTGLRNTESLMPTNLKRRHPNISFENIVLVWGFPTKLNARMIRDSLSKSFGPTAVLSVYHIDESAVFIQFKNPELVSDFLALKETLETQYNAISVLHPVAELLEGGKTRAAGYEAYKEICGSPISKVLFADQAEAVGIKWKIESSRLKVEAEREANEKAGEETSGGDKVPGKNEDRRLSMCC